MRVRRLAAAGAAALLMPFAACSEGKSNAESSEPTTSAVPSPSETASEGPTLPPEAQGDDEAAAKAFVKFYFELISEAMVSGEADELRSWSVKRCTGCRRLADQIDKAFAQGATFKTKGWEPVKLVPGNPAKSGFQFFLTVTRHPRTMLHDGKVISREPLATLSMSVIVVRQGDSWKVAWLDQLR